MAGGPKQNLTTAGLMKGLTISQVCKWLKVLWELNIKILSSLLKNV
jgi:hypothetical protein